jgi:hypothetical protein
MLDITQPMDTAEPLDPKLMDLLTQFRRIQVSLFPIKAMKTTSEHVSFYDSRFPTGGIEGKKAVAQLWIDTNNKREEVFVIQSKEIYNPRFRNERRSRNITKDPAKMLKYLKTYVQPYTARELAKMTKDVMESKFSDWRWTALKACKEVVQCDMNIIYEEAKRMAELGIRAQTARFQKVLDEGLTLYEEGKYVESRKDRDLVHLFFNPDDSISVWFDSTSDKTGGLLPHYTSFEELPEHVATRMAMLKMTAENAFVPDVGMRATDRSFWVDVGGRY